MMTTDANGVDHPDTEEEARNMAMQTSYSFDHAGDGPGDKDDPKKKRENIANTAEKHIGQGLWAKNVDRLNLSAGDWKCSLFVYEMLKEAGIDMGLPKGNWIFGGEYPYSAGDWGDPTKVIPGWAVVEKPEPGDIAAYAAEYERASGHVGIYTGGGQGVWANDKTVRKDKVDNKTWGTEHKIIYRRYVGESTFSLTGYYLKNPWH